MVLGKLDFHMQQFETHHFLTFYTKQIQRSRIQIHPLTIQTMRGKDRAKHPNTLAKAMSTWIRSQKHGQQKQTLTDGVISN